MGTMCGGGCGGPGAEAIADMNKKGIYMPKQISGQVENDWDAVNTKGLDAVSAADLKKICTTSVVNLGKLGGGDKFN